MGEFASKGVAGTGLGLGIAGTALGLLGNNGLNLGGLFGNNLANGAALSVLAEKDARIAALEAENYSDKNSKEVYAQSLEDNRAVERRINALLVPVSEAIAENQKDIAVMKMEAKKDKEIYDLKIGALQAVLAQITHTVIPQTAICPEVMPRYNSWTAPTTSTTTPTA